MVTSLSGDTRMIKWDTSNNKWVASTPQLKIGKDVVIKNNVTIMVKNSLEINEGSVINDNCIIKGVDIKIGEHFWMDTYAEIGTGSCFTPWSKFIAGNNVHIGKYSIINTARQVKIGNGVGLGIDTRIFTHGAYLSALDGYPVTFAPVTLEDNVWCPNALIHPGVTIGRGTVVATGSVVNKSLPSNCLAGGIPAKIIKENYPPKLSQKQRAKIILDVTHEACEIMKFEGLPPIKEINLDSTSPWPFTLHCDDLTILFSKKTIIMKETTPQYEILINQFRRHGIRFEKKKE